MPLPAVRSAGSFPTRTESTPNLRPVVVHSSLESKLQGVTVYGCTVIEKVSTKWRKQRRLLIATNGLLLVCGIDGKVSRVLDLSEIIEILTQRENSDSTYLLVKLGTTPSNEPDLLCCVVPNKRNTHNCSEFLSVLTSLVQHNNSSLQGMKSIPEMSGCSTIKGLARLGHNPISAKEKIRMCGNNRAKNQSKCLSNLVELDSRPTSSTVTPVMLPIAATPVDNPIDEVDREQPSLLGGFNLYNESSSVVENSNLSSQNPIVFADLSDNDVVAHSRLRANSTVIPNCDIAMAGSAAAALPPKRQRAVSFSNTTVEIENTSPATTDGGDDLTATMTAMQPFQHSGFASSMPPIKSLPEDDEGGCGWTEHKDPVSKLIYYHNDKLQKSTWHEPEELKGWKKRNGFPPSDETDDEEEDRKNDIYEKTLALSKKSTTLRGMSKGAPLLMDESEIQSDNEDSSSDDSDSSSSSGDTSSDDDRQDSNFLSSSRMSIIPTSKSKKLDIASLLDGPPVKVLKSRIPIEVVQPSFDEQPFESPSASVGVGGIAHNRMQKIPNVQLNPVHIDMSHQVCISSVFFSLIN